ncbi:hypothetical protein [Cohnella fermenti]|uniref:Uncharacterized protein n=1 Tax=Cohnella fermenti TaxID=2565925 RepID=A0A4S4BV09_9BACL|nr:hypothetical protein [Cohnella fermenti]THF78802.1 hypothetical protein E6C55_13860 [Cohnella fermenti]
MIKKAVYGAVAGIVLASWLGNYSYREYYSLPNLVFLRHYIETETIPAVAFDLYYVVDKDDDRTPLSVTVAELPELRFDPPYVHQQLSRQTIYVLRGYYNEGAMADREAMEPLRLRTVDVHYSNGEQKTEDIGEIVVKRSAWPLAASTDASRQSPVTMLSAGGSSDNGGFGSVRADRPVRLEGVSSAWLESLGDSLEYELTPNPALGDSANLESGQSARLDYRFKLDDEERINAYELRLRMNFVEPNGEQSDYVVFARADPHPTEAEMRTFVRAERGRKE